MQPSIFRGELAVGFREGAKQIDFKAPIDIPTRVSLQQKGKGDLLNNNLLSIPFQTYISMSGVTTGRKSYPVVKKKRHTKVNPRQKENKPRHEKKIQFPS